MTVRRITLADWQAEGTVRYGPNIVTWKFKCPSCGLVQSAIDYRAWNTPIRAIDVRLAFSCIGLTIRERNLMLPVVGFMEHSLGYGCEYAGGSFPRVAPLEVVFGISGETGEDAIRPMFGWAD